MSTKLKEILTKNGPYPTPLNPNSSQAKADPGLALAMLSIFSSRQLNMDMRTIKNFLTSL